MQIERLLPNIADNLLLPYSHAALHFFSHSVLGPAAQPPLHSRLHTVKPATLQPNGITQAALGVPRRVRVQGGQGRGLWETITGCYPHHLLKWNSYCNTDYNKQHQQRMPT